MPDLTFARTRSSRRLTAAWLTIAALAFPGVGSAAESGGTKSTPAADAAAKAPGGSKGGGGGKGGRGGGGAQKQAVEVVAISRRDLSESLRVVGSLTPNETATIRPEMSGLIRSIHFEEGRQVKKGDLLIKIDDSELQAQLAQTRTRHELAKLNLARAENLRQTQSNTQADVDRARSEFAAAEADIDRSGGKLAGDLARGSRERIEEDEARGGLERHGEALGDGSRFLAPRLGGVGEMLAEVGNEVGEVHDANMTSNGVMSSGALLRGRTPGKRLDSPGRLKPDPSR